MPYRVGDLVLSLDPSLRKGEVFIVDPGNLEGDSQRLRGYIWISDKHGYSIAHPLSTLRKISPLEYIAMQAQGQDG